MAKKVLFIIADTLRAKKSIGSHIDSLAKQGINFTNAYTTITKTDPSITAIMTGKYPLSIGLINHTKYVTEQEKKNAKKQIFIAEILKQNGFKTFAIDWFGRWHKKGFEYYSNKLLKNFNEYNLVFDKLPLFFYLRIVDKIFIRIFRRDFILRFYYSFFFNTKIPYDPANRVVDKIISIFDQNKKNNIFVYAHFWDAHFPHTRSRGVYSYIFDSLKKTYKSEVQFLDGEIGRLITYLKSTDQLKDCLIILTSDHGENFYGHGVPLNHECLYEDVVKVPLIFSHSSLKPREEKKLVQSIDIFPTLLDFLHIPVPNSIDGRSLLPLIKKQKREVRDFVFFEDIVHRRFSFMPSTRRSGIIKNGYKYIQTIKGNRKELSVLFPYFNNEKLSKELYHLKKDPSEKRNVVFENKMKTSEMKSELLKVINQLKDNYDGKLSFKIQKSISVIKKSAKKFDRNKIAVAWTGGKDSTVLLHLVRLAFNGKVPFRVIFNDSTMEFEEIYKFINKVKKLWNIDVITIKHSQKELEEFYKTKDKAKKKELSRIMKITAINSAIKKYKLKGFMAGIRWDEHESRSKESYFSKRKDHIRIHPILHFTEKDIWEYIHFFGVSYVELYDKGYRSLGEKPFTAKATVNGGERSGREREKENTMKTLRKMGYW